MWGQACRRGEKSVWGFGQEPITHDVPVSPGSECSQSYGSTNSNTVPEVSLPLMSNHSTDKNWSSEAQLKFCCFSQKRDEHLELRHLNPGSELFLAAGTRLCD